MHPNIKKILKIISVPLILLAIYLSMYLIWVLFGLPTDSELLVIVKNYFAHYGLIVVFVSALIEGFFLLGQYFPGGFVIFLGVISAGKDVGRASEVVLIVCIAFFIAYTLNFLLGKYGWYRLLVKFGLKGRLEHAKDKLTKHGLNAVILSYWEPNLASITATAAGILDFPLKKFSIYSLIGIVIWNIFWGTLVFLLGDSAIQIVGLKWVFIIFVVWVGVIIIKKYWFDRKKQMNKFEKIKNEILETMDKSPVKTDTMHVQIVHKWVLKLKPDADLALQIAALAHDIDRGITGITEKDLKDYSKIDQFKKEHALRSATFISDILVRYDYPESFINKVRKLVENHEVGGDEETDILTSADTIAYFEYNIPVYLERNGREQTKNKIQFMYKRTTPEIQNVVRNMNFSGDVIRELIQEAIRELN